MKRVIVLALALSAVIALTALAQGGPGGSGPGGGTPPGGAPSGSTPSGGPPSGTGPVGLPSGGETGDLQEMFNQATTLYGPNPFQPKPKDRPSTRGNMPLYFRFCYEETEEVGGGVTTSGASVFNPITGSFDVYLPGQYIPPYEKTIWSVDAQFSTPSFGDCKEVEFTFGFNWYF